ncbi:hypothetical protein BO83DRAFT_406872 [Aspergillus eucalypticola CBS 122712]|uniref:Alcohol acetyltransferase n=1 Tax=Aspergillus eucalypticola (strain CBS 122712 / IBT 29274) TaxID=1448314 RepID=A0A317VU07_ASPEC|nr:uncharacterized protein BO83DRAFT_406872 [Aspergillus eucalypticola CBS 122712]PWY77823.1 hypothetical protein BO83DRAFT_406872 [Aspergillus eucalypticola CBS 122712]
MDKLERLRRAARANVAISATYILPNAFTLPIQVYVYKALGTLISKNAALSAIPVKDDNDTWFFRLPEIDLSQTISFQKHCQIILTEPNEQHFTAIYIFHHVIADGMSGKAFHETFFEALHDAATSLALGEATRQVIPSPKLSMLPNLKAVHPCSMGFTSFLKQLFRIKIWHYRDTGLWTGPKSFTPFDIEIRQIVISETVSTALRNRCRQNQATITSAIHTAVARSLLAHLPEECTRLQAIGAMSCRRWLKTERGITDQSMGMDQYPPESFPWDAARQSCATIKQVLGREGKDSSLGLLRYVDSWGYEQSKIGEDRNGSFKASNLGAVKSVPEGDSWPQIRRKGLAESEMFEGVVGGIARELHSAAK